MPGSSAGDTSEGVTPVSAYLDGVRKAGSSCGAVIELVAEAVPAGWGAPIYGKLDAELASALMSINAVKGVEIGDGMASAALTGEENADEMRMGNDGKPRPGYDYWVAYDGHGQLNDPVLNEHGKYKNHKGYITDIMNASTVPSAAPLLNSASTTGMIPAALE